MSPGGKPVLFISPWGQLQPLLRYPIGFRNCQGIQDLKNIFLVAVLFISRLLLLALFALGGAGCRNNGREKLRGHRTQHVAKRAFKLSQAMGDQVCRCLERGFGFHDAAGILVKSSWPWSNQAQSLMDTTVLFIVQTQGGSVVNQVVFSLLYNAPFSRALEGRIQLGNESYIAWQLPHRTHLVILLAPDGDGTNKESLHWMLWNRPSRSLLTRVYTLLCCLPSRRYRF